MAAARSNEELIESLRARGVLKSARVIEAFAATPRSAFVPAEHAAHAFVDGPFKVGNLHLSAPHIYAMLLEAMDIAPGMSFLAMGSGSGYLCALAGRIVGPTGEVRGVEFHADNVDFSRRAYAAWRCSGGAESAPAATFVCGNAFALDASRTQADRVYVGAGCTPARKGFFRSFLRPGGVLVVPTEGAFLRITRTGDAFAEDVLCQVSFAPLLDPLLDPRAPPLRLPSERERRRAAEVVWDSGRWEGHLLAAGRRRVRLVLELEFGADGSVSGVGTSVGGDDDGDVAVTGATSCSAETSNKLSLQLMLHPSSSVVVLDGIFDTTIGSVFGSWHSSGGSAADGAQHGEFLLTPKTVPLNITVRFDKSGQTVALDRIPAQYTALQTIAAACAKIGIRAKNSMALVFNGNIIPDSATLVSKQVLAGSALFVVERS